MTDTKPRPAREKLGMGLLILEADFSPQGELQIYHRMRAGLVGEPRQIYSRLFDTPFEGHQVNPFMRDVVDERTLLSSFQCGDTFVFVDCPQPNVLGKELVCYKQVEQTVLTELLLLLYEYYFPGSIGKRNLCLNYRGMMLSLTADYYDWLSLCPGVINETIVAFWQGACGEEKTIRIMKQLGCWFARQTRDAINEQKRFLQGRIFGHKLKNPSPR